MNNWRLVRLDFGRSPVHFGEVGIGVEQSSERVRSDTLFSAWANGYVRLFDVAGIVEFFDLFPISEEIKNEQNDDITKQENIAPVKFSSTFIYTKEVDTYQYYLPRPVKLPFNYPNEDLNIFKVYKKLKYLPLDIWQKWYQGTGFKTKDLNGIESAYKETYITETYPKISVDRRTAGTNFYHTGLTQFNYEPTRRSGLYFLLHFPEANPELEVKLQAALNLLGENGLGGERSSGAGRFEVEYWGNLPSDWQKIVSFKDTKHHCLLSLFWRTSIEESFLNDSSYELIERGGWIGSPFSGRQLRRKKVYMFAEGSVFTSLPSGQLAVVTPDGFNKHPVYRSGIGLSLPIKVQSENRE